MHDSKLVELYERYHRRVYAYCRRRTSHDHAEDAVADTFLIALRRIHDIPEGDDALPWLFSVAYRVLGHQWRGAFRRSRLQQKLGSLGVAFVNAPDDYIVVRQESQTVLEALSNLQPRDQEILRLSVWEELSHDQVAKTLGINVDAAKKRLSRARARLTSEYQRMTKNSHPPLLRKGGAQ